jgi:hypothetical protein
LAGLDRHHSGLEENALATRIKNILALAMILPVFYLDTDKKS